jgi:hypothetical protein
MGGSLTDRAEAAADSLADRAEAAAGSLTDRVEAAAGSLSDRAEAAAGRRGPAFERLPAKLIASLPGHSSLKTGLFSIRKELG